MDKKGVLAALREIEADATLPNQQDAEVDNVRIGNQWPGIKAALVKIIFFLLKLNPGGRDLPHRHCPYRLFHLPLEVLSRQR